MLYREIIAVCSEIHTKHINRVCGLNVEIVNVKLVVQKVIFVLYSDNKACSRDTQPLRSHS